MVLDIPPSSGSDSELDPHAWREHNVFAGAAYATRFFMADADVHRALGKVTRLLREADIPYAVIGAMALNEYGYRRVTVDVDLLLRPEGLAAFKRQHLGLGYVEKFPGSKGMRDVEAGVSIDVVLTGEFPGDGKPKPVMFPDPGKVAVVSQGVALLPLPLLVELKLASGMTAPHRLKDLADVLELVRAARLPLELAQELNPFVRDKFHELWTAAQSAGDE